MKIIFALLSLAITTSLFANENNVYDFSWLDQDKEIYVLQNRKYRKKDKLYIAATGGKSISGAFIDRYNVNLYGGYFFKEDFGIELSYTKSQGNTNETHDAVKEAATVAFYRKLNTVMSAHIVWAPFYSKINTFNKIIYYDWLFGAGLSSLTTQDNRNEFKNESDADHDVLTEESVTAFSWFTGFRFYISEALSFRADVSAIHSQADRAVDDGGAGTFEIQEGWFHYYDLRLGLNYTF